MSSADRDKWISGCLFFGQWVGFPLKSRTYGRRTGLVHGYPHDCSAQRGITGVVGGHRRLVLSRQGIAQFEAGCYAICSGRLPWHGRRDASPACLNFKQNRQFPGKSMTCDGHTRLVQGYPHDCPAWTGITGGAQAAHFLVNGWGFLVNQGLTAVVQALSTLIHMIVHRREG